MKTIMTVAALVAMMASTAGAFSFPEHVQNGYRDTGCVASKQVDMGGYSNNPTCNGDTGNAPDTPAPTVQYFDAVDYNGVTIEVTN